MKNITHFQTKGVLPPLQIGHLTSRLPIIQGGMGVGVSRAGLSSAVANEGGIGTIAAAGIGMLENDFDSHFKEANARALKREILLAKSKTDGLIAVNIMIALSDHESLLQTAIESQADIVFMGAGLPLKIPQLITPEQIVHGRTRIVPIISSARAAQIICNSWLKQNCLPDAFVVEGPLAGGHLGFSKDQINDSDYTLEQLLKSTIETLIPFEDKAGRKIPVIAAGGVYSGADIEKLLRSGAGGVQMATRFVATHECDAHSDFKEMFINAGKNDLMIIDSPVGLPGRAIRNKFLKRIETGGKAKFTCPWKCLRTCDFHTAPYCIGKALVEAQLGRLENGFAFAGANVWRVNEIVSVKELMEMLIAEYKEAACRHESYICREA